MRKHKHATRFALAFFSIMIVLTLCSRTIYRSTLPQVRVERPFGGVLKITSSTNQYTFDTIDPIYQYIPQRLPQSLRITEVHVSPGDKVATGDPLLTFYAPDGELMLDYTTSELDNVTINHQVWQTGLEKEIATTTELLAEARTDSEMRIILNELMLLQDGYYNGSTASNWREEIMSLTNLKNILLELQANHWVFTSDSSGIVCEIGISPNTLYSGVDPLVNIASEDSVIYMQFVLEDALSIQPATWFPTIKIETSEGTLSTDATFVDNKTIQIELPQDVDVSSIAQAIVTFESSYEQMLIPNEAINGNYLYVLENTVGDWGVTVYKARKVSIESGHSDTMHTVVVNGISKNDRVIVMATTELHDGQIVILDDFD